MSTDRVSRPTLSFVVTVALAGSVVGILEGFWLNANDPVLTPTEALLIIAWAALACAVPALLLVSVLVLVSAMLPRAAFGESDIPAVLIPLGVWLALQIHSHLDTVGISATLLIQVPASAALALGVCYILYLLLGPIGRARVDSPRIWLFLLLLSLSFAMSWLANTTFTPPRILAMLTASAAAGFCLLGLRRNASTVKLLIGATSFTILTLVIFIGWRPFPERTQAGGGEIENVLLITIDTLRADHLGSYGYAMSHTPNIDAIAADGLIFENAVAPSSITVPSHASILSGLDPIRHGALSNQGTPLDKDIQTLPKTLQSNGYETAAFISGMPLKHEISGLGTHFSTYDQDFSPWAWWPDAVEKLRGLRVPLRIARILGLKFERHERPAEQTTESVIRWLDQAYREPFFLWVHYYDPHIPYAPPAPYDTLFDPDYTGNVDGHWYELNTRQKERVISDASDLRHMIALYDGEAAYVDSQVARLRDALARLELTETTLVIITSDHGESHGEHSAYFTRNLYWPCLQVPLIILPPGKDVRSKSIPEQVRLIDIAPTVLDYLNITNSGQMDGESLLSLVEGGEPEKTRPAYAVLIRSPGDQRFLEGEGGFAIQDLGHKLIWNSSRWGGDIRIEPWEEFYDLVSDQEEVVNIVEKESAVLTDLRQRLTIWRALGAVNTVEVSPETIEALKSLGYIR